MIFRKKRIDRWTEYDWLLSEAYDIFDAERCPRCGLPIYVCHTLDEDVRFRVEQDDCSAMAAVELHEEGLRAQNKNWKRDAGATFRPVPYTVNGRELSSFRDPYWEAEAERRRIIAESHKSKR